MDAQKFNANVVDIRGEEIVSIDHHPTFIPATYRFSDIRPDVGSCAAIIASYFFENDIPISKNAGHRIGVKSMASVVEKYGGVYGFFADGKEFRFQASM